MNDSPVDCQSRDRLSAESESILCKLRITVVMSFLIFEQVDSISYVFYV